MVKSASCFKIITCGSDSAENDDQRATEKKNSCDKRRWSFRKRSARHRVLSNNVSMEAPTIRNKEVPDSGPLNFETHNDIIAPEKISVVHCVDEKPQLPTVVKAEVPDIVVKEEEEPEVIEKVEVPAIVKEEEEPENIVKVEVPAIVKEEEEPENIVKVEVPDTVAVTEEVPEVLSKTEVLDSIVTVKNDCDDAKIKEAAVIAIQAAVRNFLALRELVKLKKLVKLQAAVRGHIVRRHAVGTIRCVQAIVKMQALIRARHARVSSEKDGEDLVKKPSGGNPSFEKLLSNGFARQMLESTPKTKPIHVKCDPSKPDSAWKWLERWMSVSAVNAADFKKLGSVAEEHEEEREAKPDSQLVTITESEVICEPTDSKCFSLPESVAPSESEDNLITYEADKFDFEASHYTNTSTKDDFENTSTSGAREASEDVDSLHTRSMPLHTDSEPEKEAEEPKCSLKRLASEELETEGSKFTYGSKKVTEPSFDDSQSKFEEFTSVEESRHDTSYEVQSVIKTEVSAVESPVDESRAQIGGSECGTELSVTSTLDSPDRSEIGAMEHAPEPKVVEEAICDRDNYIKDSESEANGVPKILESNTDLPEKLDAANSESADPVVSETFTKTDPTPETSDIQREHRSRITSPDASPRSFMTGAESQGTPNSQLSVKEKKKKKSDKKRPSLSTIKKSPKTNSGSKASEEKPLKEQKSAKRRNSFGTTKAENGDQEPRDSSGSSNNLIPHFMQATLSARAKLNSNSSPRSSPDVHDGDNYAKKRLSLPGANGRQGSPRVERSPSQPQPAAKGTERKWQR